MSTDEQLVYKLAINGGSADGASTQMLQIIHNGDGAQIIDWLSGQYQLLLPAQLSCASVARITVDCNAAVEFGTDISQAFLTNIANNQLTLAAECSQAIYIDRTGRVSVLGYGTCSRFKTIEEAEEVMQLSHRDALAIGGQDFSFSKNSIWGWIIPRLDIRSSGSGASCNRWPNITLAINIQLNLSPDQDLVVLQQDWKYQLHEALTLLSTLSWEFRPQIASKSIAIPPLVSDLKYSGMSEDQYLQAVHIAVSSMSSSSTTAGNVSIDAEPFYTDVNSSFVMSEQDSVLYSSPEKQQSSNNLACDTEDIEVSLQKVVYALRKTGQATSTINAAALLQLVASNNPQDHGKRYYFLFAPQGRKGPTFISLSPELLCHVDGRNVETEALAGTFPAAEVDLHNEQLLSDDKNSREHSAVADFAYQILSRLDSENGVQILDRELLRMKDVVHLKRKMSVTTTEDSDLEGISLLSWTRQNLHPTPAVCGVPTQLALSLIQRNEKFARGLYSSSCGVLSSRGGELFVGLRSALVDKATVHVFAGAGIVQGSDPKSELAEINLKMAQYLRVLTSIRRPAMQFEFANATAASAAIVVEECLRQGVRAFCVCPGSRSTPLAVAIYRNSVSRSMTQVVHDERSAGFYALGCARCGVLCAVLVTSGTAVSNLLPAVSEARESGYSILLLTTDRPSESRDVGEAQTIRQVGLFSSSVGWERDFPPWDSESPKRSAALTASLITDISFAVGEIAIRRNRVVQLNFQYRKAELEPEVVVTGFKDVYCAHLPQRVRNWLSQTRPYTQHVGQGVVPPELRELLSQWVCGSWRYWSMVILAGELRSMEEALNLKLFCEQFSIPCICDVTSMLQSHATNSSSEVIFTGVDRLCNSQIFLDTLSSSIRMVFRVGGSMISAKLTEWMGQNIPLAKIIRVRDDWSMDARHDSTWSADYYVHSSLKDCLKSLTSEMMKAQLSQQRNSLLDTSTHSSINACDALRILRIVNHVNQNECIYLENDDTFSEPQIARTIFEVLGNDHSPVFLSSSMACRDFDNYSGPVNIQALSNEDVPLGQLRRIGCNRGANGIDGVLSTAAGFAACSATEGHPVTVLIGDIACLHDVSGLGIAAGCQPVTIISHTCTIVLFLIFINFCFQGSRGLISSFPGGGKVGKIVCVNNSGGAIFSFLAAAKYKNSSSPDFFTPLLDTPHDINISLIADALLTGEMVADGSKRRAVRVSNASELRTALANNSIFFIECVSLPSHEMNVQIHKDLNAKVAAKIVAALKKPLVDGLHWSLFSKKPQVGNSKIPTVGSKPLVVLLHGWLGSETDWKGVVGDILDNDAIAQKCWSVLTVSTDCELYSPTLFCHALRDLIYQLLSFNDTSRPLIIIGYSQGGRLGMHYRHLFPQDVQDLVCISTVSGKPLDSGEFERNTIDLWESSGDGADKVEVFLNKWYTLPVFSNFRKRLPSVYSQLVAKRIEGSLDADLALRNMVRTSVTANAKAELVVVGSLDTKYTALAHASKINGMVDEAITIKNCGHCLLAENPQGLKSILGDFLPRVLSSSGNKGADANTLMNTAKHLAVCKISITQIDIRLQAPLVVLSNGTTQSFESRRGMRVVITVSELEDKNTFKEKKHFSGVGEVYEPVFEVSEPNLSYNGLVDETFSLSSVIEQWTGSVLPSAEGIANAVLNALSPVRNQYSAVCVYGFEQCMLHAMAQFMCISLVDAIGAYIGGSLRRRSSHIKVNGFASLRDGQSSPFPITNKYYKAMKLKVGSSNGDNAEQDAEQVNAFVAANVSSTTGIERKGWLRLDANQSWSVDQARLFIEHLSPQALRAIDYVEEPLRFDCSDKDWQRLRAPSTVDGSDIVSGSPVKISNTSSNTWSDVAIAFDESLCNINRKSIESSASSNSNSNINSSRNNSPRKSISMNNETANKVKRLIEMHPSRTRFIIKPSLLSLKSEHLLSGWTDSMFSNLVTISCTFECAAGLAFLVCIAAWYGDTPHGIHARADMAEKDDFTRQFSDILRPGQGGDMEIRVWEAEQLLNNIALSYSNT